MKNTVILASALAALLLSGCSKDSTEHINAMPNTREYHTSETANTSVTEQTAEVSAAVSKTEAAGTLTETENTESEFALPENMKLLNVSKYNGGHSGFGVLKGSIYCEILKNSVRFYDINTQTLEAKIDFPAGKSKSFIRTDSSCLCKILILSKENDNDQVFTVYRDYTYDIADYAPETVSFSVCGHNIAEYGYDIIDIDKNVKILEGGIWKDSENFGYKFLFEIDKNRFVYQKMGDVHSFGFGIYDFETSSDVYIADTESHVPFGFHDGKIYSDAIVYCPDDPIGNLSDDIHNCIYVTDIETGEKRYGFSFPLPDSYNLVKCRYAMPESGEFIALLATPYELETPKAFCIIDPDTGEIIREYEIPHEIICRSVWFAGNDTAVIADRNGGNKMIIADLSR